MWSICDKEHEARAHIELCVLTDKLSLSSTVDSHTNTENKCWVIGCQQNTVLDYELFKPSHVKSSQSQVMSKQVNSQWKFKVQKFSYRSLPNVLRTSILLNKLTRKLRDVQAVRGGVLWEPAGLKTGSAAGAFFR